MEQYIRNALNQAQDVINEFYSIPANIEKIEHFGRKIADCFKNGNKVMIFGNGGSACDAAHFAEEFTGRFRKDREPLPVMLFNDAGHVTCVANDFGYDYIFERGVRAFAKSGDIAIGISTSGESRNIILGLEAALELEVTTCALLGKSGGQMKDKYDYQWVVPSNATDRIQELQMTILHIIIETVERILYPSHYED